MNTKLFIDDHFTIPYLVIEASNNDQGTVGHKMASRTYTARFRELGSARVLSVNNMFALRQHSLGRHESL